mgnify:FL=1
MAQVGFSALPLLFVPFISLPPRAHTPLTQSHLSLSLGLAPSSLLL